MNEPSTRGSRAGEGPSRDGSAPPGRDPLVIHDVAFLGGMAQLGGWRPDNDLPEIAFMGRSNVGKSSLLNKLVRRKSFARVSNTPGRTREINFFLVNGTFVFVDLPGYGYARVSKERKADWRPLMDAYLRHTRQLRGIVLLLDARRDPSDEDLATLDYLAELEVPVMLAVTKVDKFTATAASRRVTQLAIDLAMEADQLIPFSAVTGEGRDELGAAIAALMQEAAWRPA